MKEKQEFEKYLQKTLREIKSKYAKLVGPRGEVYLSMTIIKQKKDKDIHVSYNNDYWRGPKKTQLNWWEERK